MSRIPDLSEPLSDGRVLLRPAAERDIPEALIAHQDDPELFRALGMERPPSGAQLGREFEQAGDARAAGSHFTLTILEHGSDDCRGQVRAHGFEWDHARAALELWVVPEARSRRLGRAALRLAAVWLFEACRIERVQLLAAPANEPLIRAAHAAGFHSEGIFRAYDRQRDERLDRLVLSLLPADLRAHR